MTKKLDRCERCGKSFSWTDCKIYTPYGGYLDDEPPGDKIICKKCWDTMSEEIKKIITKTAWQKNW